MNSLAVHFGQCGIEDICGKTWSFERATALVNFRDFRRGGNVERQGRGCALVQQGCCRAFATSEKEQASNVGQIRKVRIATRPGGYKGGSQPKENALERSRTKVVRYCRDVKINIPAGDAHHFATFHQQFEQEEILTRNPSHNPLIVALGLDLTISEASIQSYNGGYLHFTLDDDGRVVVSKYVLSRNLGPDLAPLYRSWRNVPGSGRRRFVGAYFANDANLYLVGTPIRSVDLRLCIFNIIPGEKQKILRGVVLGVSYRGTILTSRCLLVRLRSISSVRRKVLVEAPLPREAVQKDLPEVADFLFGIEKPDYIKLSTGE